ncbi:hypothetical protein [Actinoplanes sp. NPDC051411]|uniref:hypothetical protein n=1 Tax=Actinoplanes sp. NPDC051411 TaxID=3155522 RepID=UPI0034357087
MRGLVGMVTAAMVVVLAGCGSPDSRRAQTVDPPARADSGARAVANRIFSAKQLEDALLSVSELPTGWSVDPESDNSSTKDSSGEYAECPQLGAVIQRYRDAPAAEFKSPAAAAFSEGLLSLPPAEAKKMLTDFSAAVAACRKLSIDGGYGRSFDMFMSGLSFPQVGDETFAFRATAQTVGVTVSMDQVLVRRAGVVLAISNLTTGGTADTTATEDVTRRALSKVDKVLR